MNAAPAARVSQRSAAGVSRLALDLPEVIDCHHVTGEDCFFVKLVVADVEHLERVIDRFRTVGRTISSVALSTTVEDKPPLVPLASHG